LGASGGFVRVFLALVLLASQAAADVRVVDGDTFDLDGQRYRINGIDAPEAGQKCQTRTGKQWSCGTAATEALFEIMRGANVRCDDVVTDDYGRTVGNCTADGRDIGAQMVRAGMAWAFVKFSDVYVAPQEAAKAERLGIWQGKAEPAWDFRSARWEVAEQTAPDGCPIKGNISPNGKIYHPPWSPWYNRTKITETKGERWFCDEAEAVKAGWRAPYWK
jgi:endonuclease YncB( thermonuclease family)